jgi:hypothetical protein
LPAIKTIFFDNIFFGDVFGRSASTATARGGNATDVATQANTHKMIASGVLFMVRDPVPRSCESSAP